ncbi:MAG: hypothetical protein Q8877_03095, partial [Sweet potato little leaf phytoplasma]|nr:hypothetical protein [Sweet potato little leaf phytoplasma]
AQTKLAGIFLAKKILSTNRYKNKKNIVFIHGSMGLGYQSSFPRPWSYSSLLWFLTEREIL